MVSVEFALLLWIIILVAVFFILKAYRITWWSSLVFSLLVSWIVLCLVYPFSSCGHFGCRGEHCNNDSNGWKTGDALFLFVGLITIIIVIIYLIQRVFRDREDHTPHQQVTQSPYEY